MRILNQLYNAAAFLLSIPAGGLFLLKRRGRARLLDRYGLWGLSSELQEGERLVWFHGASMGEVNGLAPVIREFRRRFPGFRVLLTATSISGMEKGREVADFVRLLPFDSRPWIHSALGRLPLEVLVISETEIWPGLLEYLQRRAVKVALINAIISEYSYRNYCALKPLLAGVVDALKLVLTMDERSRERFIELGVASDRVRTAGNSKYDLSPSISSREAALDLRAQFFGSTHAVLTLGSLRPGEDDLWFPALAEKWLGSEKLNVVVAPRHREKFEHFAGRLETAGLPFVRWSERRRQGRPVAQSKGEIVLLDTLGDLESVYSFSDVSFIGGTLVDWGGHNPLEAAAYGSVIVLGPYVSRIADIVEILRRHAGLLEVRLAEDAGRLIENLSAGQIDTASAGRGARQAWEEASGATARILDGLAELLR